MQLKTLYLPNVCVGSAACALNMQRQSFNSHNSAQGKFKAIDLLGSILMTNSENEIDSLKTHIFQGQMT